ncbi:MAG: hypothetical protein ACHQT8_05915 [Chlamydiales bacterium]
MYCTISFLLLMATFLSSCLSTGYNQPVYIISDGTQEEVEVRSQDEEKEIR